MATMRGSKKSAIGLFVDGLEIKFAHLSKKGKSVVIDELRSASLITKLEERQLRELSGSDSFGEGGSDTFAIPTGTEKAESTEDNNAVMLGLLAPYNPSSYILGYAISEPSIYYHTVESDFGLKGTKLKEKIIDELRKVRSVQPPTDAVDVFYSSDKNLVCAVREDGISLYRSIEEIRSFLNNRVPRIPLIETSDVALMNLARANYGFAPDEISAIVYVGVEFTRLIFLKGAEFFHFAPVLGEGYDSLNIQNTVYSRLLLEQDNLGIPRIDRILLAGESRRISFDEFLKEQLPEIDIQYLRTPYLDTSLLPAELQEQIPEFAVAIATAWKLLEEDNAAFYPINLLPEFIREGQRTFKLGWHGYTLLLLIFLCTFYFTWQIGELQSVVSAKEDLLKQKQQQLAESRSLQAKIASIEEQMGRYKIALSVYDSLVPGYDRWSTMLEKVTTGVDNVNSLWVTDLKSTQEGDVLVDGFSIFRSRIPKISRLYENTMLRQVLQKDIREKTVYSYELAIPKGIEIKRSDVNLNLPPTTEQQQPADPKVINN
jgi:hypothetical protein